MQIFVKHPSTGKTVVFDCSPQTTLEGFVEWVEDTTGWPPRSYFMTKSGKPISYPYEQQKTFAELTILKDETITLTGRMTHMTP